MSSIVAPRVELPLIDQGGRVTREWYRYLVYLGKSIASPTLEDDLNILLTTEAANFDSVSVPALQAAMDAQVVMAMLDLDKPSPPDMSLLAWWPGETK